MELANKNERSRKICKNWLWSLLLFNLEYISASCLDAFVEKGPRNFELYATFFYVLTFFLIWSFITFYCGYLRKGTKWLFWLLIMPLPFRFLQEAAAILKMAYSLSYSSLTLLFITLYALGPVLYFGIMTYFLRQENLKLKGD